MLKSNKRKLQLTAIVLASAMAIAAIGCSSGQQEGQEGGNEAQEPAQAVYKSLDEWVEIYPNEGKTFMASTMAHTYDAFYGACTAAFGLEDAPFACASCHARDNFKAVYEELGTECLDDNSADYDPSTWSNCSNCHVGDPGDAVVEPGNMYGALTSASASELFPEEDMVCGQCHAMFPGAALMEDANLGFDQYKYGYEPEEMLKAYKEDYAANPITGTPIGAGMVGVSYLDPAIGSVIYFSDPCTALEVFQDGTHQTMGLTCTDCHMTQSTAEDGSSYTNHNMTASPLENPDALAKCMTCHESQGVASVEAMVEFVKSREADLLAIVESANADLEVLYGLLASAVADGGVDADVLAAAQEAYSEAKAYVYYVQGSGDASLMAPMNFGKVQECCEKAEAIAEAAIATLQ